MATVAVQQPQHPHGFLLHHHQQPSYADSHPQPAVIPQAQPVVQPKPPPADPYYGHEELARICSRFIRHVFNCPAESAQPLQPNAKPTESTIPLPRFIAYAFHRTRLPQSVAFHSLFLLSRLKSRYPAASCAFGHRLFLTSYMLSSKVICDDTYSNKSWAIVGQGFYDLRDVNLMEREMIHYLSWDLTISGPDLAVFSEKVRGNYKRGVPKAPYVVIPDTSREKDHFGKGSIEEPKKSSPVAAVAAPTPAPITVPSDPPPRYTSHASSPDAISPYSDSSESSSSSRASSPPSPVLKTPPDDASSPTFGQPVHIEHVKHIDEYSGGGKVHIRTHESTAGYAAGTVW